VTRQTQKSTFRRDDDTFRIRRELTVITSVGEVVGDVVGDVVVSSDVAGAIVVVSTTPILPRLAVPSLGLMTVPFVEINTATIL
jgi:hypothetical protein